MQKFISPIPLSLYIHIPWCIRKCPYCDFNSHEFRNNIPEELYIDTLLHDLKDNADSLAGREFVSIFFGGGTPSLFSPQAIERILSGINAVTPIKPNTEITLEANPGSVDESRFKGFRLAGINRLSLGIQSLQNEKLQRLGRIHNRDSALKAIETAQMAGFENMNLDLMHGLPDQSTEDALKDLSDALAYGVPHLSWYQLTIEPNTFFHHHPPLLPPEDVLWTIQEQGKTLLDNANLKQYEVSAYCRPSKACLHNLNYWEFGDYLGIGAGAHSKITDFESHQVKRHWQVKNPKEYLDKSKQLTGDRRILSKEDIIFEFMLNALRLSGGISIKLFCERTGLPEEVLHPFLFEARNKKLLEEDAHHLRPTGLGQRFLNDLLSLFLVSNK